MHIEAKGGSVLTLAIGLSSAAMLLAPIGLAEIRLALALVATAALGMLAVLLILPKLDPERAWDAIEVALLAGCLAIGIVIVIAAVVTALPGHVTAPVLVAASLLAVLALGLAAARRGTLGRPISPGALQHAIMLFIIAVPFRFIDLGYSEFQGDEASILHRASAITQDVNEALLAHRKGPGEILVATYFGDVVGRVAESDARVPFAAVSVLSVLAIYASGRAMFGPTAGLIAGSLWAVNGYSIGFGRIVQYHSITVLLCTTALLLAWKAEGASPRRWALRQGSLALLGLSLVFGFNVIILGLPAALVLARSLVPGWGIRGGLLRLRSPRLADGLIALVGVALAIYVTLEWRDMWRLLSYRLGHGQPFNNLHLFASVSVRYLGQPYLLVVVGVSLAAAVWLVARTRASRLPARLMAVTLAGLLVVFVALHAAPTWFAIIMWLLLGLSCVLAPSEDRPLKLLGLAALLPIGLYGFLLAQTGTHWYEAFLPMVLIVGAVGSRLARSISGRNRWACSALGFILLLVLGSYPFYAFIPLWPRDAQMPLAELYSPPWRAEREGGSFGFPHQDGLKAIALIQEIGSLPQPYESNASPEVTRWYMPNAERCDRPAGSYIVFFSERRPSRPLPGGDIWVIRVRGAPRALVRDQTDTPRGFSQLSNEAPAGWFDEVRARLERPLTVERRLCSDTMSPSWVRN